MEFGKLTECPKHVQEFQHPDFVDIILSGHRNNIEERLVVDHWRLKRVINGGGGTLKLVYIVIYYWRGQLGVQTIFR